MGIREPWELAIEDGVVTGIGSAGGGGVHDDSEHSGSAKRNGANGVAGINAASKVPDALLEKPVGTHEADTSTHGVTTVADAADLTAHTADTTAIHGITDTSKLSVIGSGSYVGDNTVNRAIAHGLGVIPELIIFSTTSIATPTYSYPQKQTKGRAYHDHYAIYRGLTVTIMDSTNFYVGNAADYMKSGNSISKTYWTAFA